MTRKFVGHFIGNEFVKSDAGATFTTVNPATGEVLADVARGQHEDVNKAVQAAKAAFQSGVWSGKTAKQRSDLLLAVSEAITKNKYELAQLESMDTGKPISETLNGDIPRAAANFKFYAELLLRESESKEYPSPDGSLHTVRREALGVCGLITPWNLPLYLETWKVAPALAMGNSVVLKPAELTPLTAHALCSILKDCGLPAGVFNVVHGYGEKEAGEALVAHPDVSCVSFTGETSTGKAIMRKAADTLKKLSFELGGKGASVVFADADMAATIPAVTKSAFRNQGQICLAGSRLLVEESAVDTVIAGVLEEVARIKIGSPLQEETTMGALISQEHRDKVRTYISLASSTEDHTLLAGGDIPKTMSASGAFLSPTVIRVKSQQSPLIQEEIFGPVLTIQTFKTKEEAAELLNGTKYGLSCSVWTQNEATANFMSRAARTGMVWINSWFLRNLATPFGGMKASGIGREGGTFSFDFFSEWKTIAKPGGV